MDMGNTCFSEWALLAATDAEVFERRRQECIDEFLCGSGPHRQRLEALQSRIDAQRRCAGTPQESVLAITLMMCSSLSELAGEMRTLCSDLDKASRPPALPDDAAYVACGAATATYRPLPAPPVWEYRQERTERDAAIKRPALSRSSRVRSE